MKKIILIFGASFLMLASIAQSPKISIIPQPVEVKEGVGTFVINASTKIVLSKEDPSIKKVAASLNGEISAAAGFSLNIAVGSRVEKNTIYLQLLPTPDAKLGDEGYRLVSSVNEVTISANKPAGLFYGVQTLLQLLPNEIESQQVVKNKKWTIPAVSIMDNPRFAWRGLMLDVSRHFFTKDEVKIFIDDMSKYKYNRMHFHLTDDQGWRIEIKSLPKLTEVGAWNVKKTGRFNFFTPPGDDEPRNYGGFYTQEDIKELIQYAKDRFVEIMPEIDIPGHSLAAVASYPELTCTPGTYKVNSGEQFMNWYDGGFSAMIDNTLCPANEKVYTFLDKVFGEISALFPFEYIHMGGDECAKNFWEINPQIKELMQREKLKDMHEVQSYFVGRVNKIISSKGKKMMGWDEILEGGLVEGAAVMSWRGMKGGIEAVKLGHEVVMTPNSHVYLDFMQTDGAIEPPVYASLRLKKVYELEPVPDGVNPKMIKGTQANVWSEQLFNNRHLQYMVWPRAFAVSEVAWSPKTTRNWNDFIGRVEDHFDRFNFANRKFAPSIYDPVVKAKKNEKDMLFVDFDSEIGGLDIYYSFDNSFPDNYYPKYTGKSIEVPVDAAPMKLISYRNGKPIGRMMTITIEELRKRAGKK
jgi:hexosaminidase